MHPLCVPGHSEDQKRVTASGLCSSSLTSPLEDTFLSHFSKARLPCLESHVSFQDCHFNKVGVFFGFLGLGRESSAVKLGVMDGMN